jgi:acyl-CoA dehydrogenase
MDFSYTDTQQEIRAAVRKLCGEFGLDYWRERDEAGAYPEEFVDAMADRGSACSMAASFSKR